MSIQVNLWGKKVGVLVKTEQGFAFEYDKNFRNSNIEISPINMPLQGKDIYVNETIWEGTQKIPGFIYDSLPDSFGLNLLQQFFLSKGLTENDIDIFTKLQYLGKRAMGALEFEPATDCEIYDNNISITEIEKIAEIANQNKNSFETDIGKANALENIIHIGTSAGGARVKALISIHKKTGKIKSGQLALGNEYNYYLIKIDGANNNSLNEPTGYGKLEYAYYLMAKECGIYMMDSFLFNESHFITKRFDREVNGNKLHIHSLCGLLGLDYQKVGEYSYEQYFMAARRLGLGQDVLEEIFRRMVFNVFAHNCDDHTKNFSFIMNNKGEWKLSPAYDLCYSYDSNNIWVDGHNMRINLKRKNITKDDLLAVGENFNIKKRNKIIEKICEIVNNFQDYAKNCNVPEHLVKEVEQNRPKF